MRRPLWVLLIVSLMANAIAVGVWIGRRGFASPGPDFLPAAAHEALAALPPERRQALAEALAEARRAAVEHHGARAEGHRRLIAILTAPQFDAQAWREAAAASQAARAARGERLTEAVAALAVDAGRTERLALAALLHDRPKERGRAQARLGVGDRK